MNDTVKNYNVFTVPRPWTYTNSLERRREVFSEMIKHLTVTGFPGSPSLAIAIAEEIRENRYQVARLPPSYLRPTGKSWLHRFRARHPEIQGIWTRKIDGARHKAMSVETVKK